VFVLSNHVLRSKCLSFFKCLPLYVLYNALLVLVTLIDNLAVTILVIVRNFLTICHMVNFGNFRSSTLYVIIEEKVSESSSSVRDSLLYLWHSGGRPGNGKRKKTNI